ncbi:AAA family ATPase [Microbacterium sp. RU33B]|uniref:AAA family ATPase n=1 Tax=Microbacterium sp. RU33B TaxID=1907390 RepID=UPI00095C2E93|nr:AAA family ATPase [Microbacterium sp. RU33B]SIT71885.1 ATPase family associated with various cellular activities (AAA) [Microbacterium sp. RU33B]
MISGELWGALGVEAARGVRAVLREALDDGGLASVGTVTTTLPSAALRGDADLAVDAALIDVRPVTWRSGSSPADERVIGVTYTFLVSMEQASSAPSDDLVIRAFGAIAGRLAERPVRLYVSPTLGALGALVFTRGDLGLADQAAVFTASGQSFARAAVFHVRVSRGIGEPDIPAPRALPGVVAWQGERRFVVVHGGTPHLRRAVAEAIAGSATIAHVDLGQVESAWIGETEKGIAAALDAVSATGAVLLFDEADALFARRTEVRDAHDRYAAIVVTTADGGLAKELARRGAEVVDAGDGDPAR